jgi:hypothetical protein
MNMNKRAQLLSLATVTALAFGSTAPRADDENVNVADSGYNQSAEISTPLSCAEATKAAWFYRQLEVTDGDTSPEVATPAECRGNNMLALGDDAK